jgi:glycosyltransferase involved in cell wall biosynthesis
MRTSGSRLTRDIRKIAILGSRGFPSTYGGYETLVRYLARDWSQRGYDVTVYCRDRNQGDRRWETDGVTCQWTPGYDSTSLSTLTFGATSHVHAAPRKFDAALVLNIANGFWLPLLRTAGVPTVVNTDGIEWERGKWGALARRTFLASAWMASRYADVLIADSQAIDSIWQKKFGVKSVFVPYGAPVEHNVGSERVRALGVKPHKYVLAVARLIPENNVDLLLGALDAATEERPTAVVVGSATCASDLQKELGELDQRGRLRWLGHVSDQDLLLELWANAGVYVHGHSVGGTNPALLQALGAGAPTLALDTPFNREVLGEGAGDQLFAKDPNELLAAISRVLRDHELQQKLAKRGRAVVEARYSWSDVSDRYLDALRLARERAAGRSASHDRPDEWEIWGVPAGKTGKREPQRAIRPEAWIKT